MTAFTRDPIGNLVAFAIGVLIGLRAVVVVREMHRTSTFLDLSGGVFIGLGVTVAFVFGLAIWRFAVAHDGTAWPRLTTAAIGMLLGALVLNAVYPA